MIEYGIHTTQAHYWVHFFPIVYRVYWYRVDHMRAFILRHSLPVTIGKSKNEVATGAGYLVPNTAYCVMSETVPPSYCDVVQWRNLTDREAGMLGEEIVEVLIEHKIIQFPAARVLRMADISDQYRGIDFSVKWFQETLIEAKTERVTSDNLFVQARERDHAHSVAPKLFKAPDDMSSEE